MTFFVKLTHIFRFHGKGAKDGQSVLLSLDVGQVGNQRSSPLNSAASLAATLGVWAPRPQRNVTTKVCVFGCES